ncbi:MAG: tol-pal system protein YbgF [Reyranellaceae bacterium]
MFQVIASLPPRPLRLGGMALGAALGLAIAAPVQAQTVEDRLARLEREMQNIERRVYVNDMPTSLAGQRGEAPVQLAQAGNYAVEDRMNGLERQMTVLTGQVEDLDIKLRQLTARLDKLTTDLEFRISQLEGGAPAGAAPSGGAPRPPMAGVTPPPSQPQVGQPVQLPSTTPLTQPQAGSPQAGAPAAGGPPQPGVLRPPAPGQGYVPSVAAPPPGTQQAAAPAAPAGGTVEQQYEAAQQMLRAGQYAAAEQTLRDIVARNPRHQLAASAQYWLGETFYVRQDYQNAAVAFADGYKNYPKGNKAPDTMLKLGMSLSAMKKDQDACAVYDRLSKEYPNAPEIVRRRATEERRKSRCG